MLARFTHPKDTHLKSLTSLWLGLGLAATALGSALAAAPVSGIDTTQFDTTTRIQDDTAQYVNGTWLKNTEIPADKSSWGSFAALHERTQPQLRALVEAAAAGTQQPGTEAQKIGDLYSSFMDETRRNSLGLSPIQPQLNRIAAIKDKKQLAGMIAELQRVGVTTPLALNVHQDAKDATRYVADLSQSGLGLPDRDYYLKDDDVKLKQARTAYLAHVQAMLTLSDDPAAAAHATDILALETALAKVQWSNVENRDPVKLYNPVPLAKLSALAPAFAWADYLKTVGVAAKVKYLVVSQPSYVKGLNTVWAKQSLDTWKHYLRFQLLNSAAPYLSQNWVDQRFEFYGKALRGVPQNLPAWQRAMRVEDAALGEALGKLYVEKHYSAQSQERMEKMVANLLAAMNQSIATLDWMSPATQKQAKAKLATFMPKIGYPKQWRDYSGLTIDRGDLMGNVQRSRAFEFDRDVAKLGKPIDRSEWMMTPQTVNAYYNPELNEIVFPAVMLQPPFFDAKADDAVNYGAIGAVIGHEISHGFDDEGSQYDGLGNLRDWWTKADHANFAKRTQALVQQFNAYSPLPGYTINGELTLGENIADTSGLAIALKAYRLSLGDKAAPVIDGLTGEQRFFIGWAQAWRSKMRDAQTLVQIKSDPHSPDPFRIKGALVNQPDFYKAFDIKPGDKMYVEPEKRVVIW